MQNQIELFNLQDLNLRINNSNDLIECTLDYDGSEWFGQIHSSDLTSQIIDLNKLEKILKLNYQNTSNNFTFQLKLNDDRTNLILIVGYLNEFIEWSEQIIFKQKSINPELSYLLSIINEQQKQINKLMKFNDKLIADNEQINLRINEIEKNNQYFSTSYDEKERIMTYNIQRRFMLLPKNHDFIRLRIAKHSGEISEFYTLNIGFQNDDDTVVELYQLFGGSYRFRIRNINGTCSLELNAGGAINEYHGMRGLTEKEQKYLKFINFDKVLLFCNDEILNNFAPNFIVDFINTYCDLTKTEITFEHVGTKHNQTLNLK